jgi:hypothetical protein
MFMQGIENKRTKDLSEDELTKLREEVDKYTTEGDLRRYVSLNIKRLKEIGSYRGRRHINVGGRCISLVLKKTINKHVYLRLTVFCVYC